MKKLFLLSAILIVISASYYASHPRIKIETCIHTEKNQNCHIHLKKEIIGNLLGNKINIPETEATATIDEIVSYNNQNYYKGHYTNKIDTETIETGNIIFDANKILILSNSIIKSPDLSFYALPFTISGSGSGNFNYIGLFSYKAKEKESTHLSSYFIGDRVQQIKTTLKKNIITITFNTHGNTQSLAETPSQKETLKLFVTNKTLNSKRPYSFTAMHPSWDKNGDGLNDCEKDGSCDHTTDYTQQRD